MTSYVFQFFSGHFLYNYIDKNPVFNLSPSSSVSFLGNQKKKKKSIHMTNFYPKVSLFFNRYACMHRNGKNPCHHGNQKGIPHPQS
jgi:hypothetical protein